MCRHLTSFIAAALIAANLILPADASEQAPQFSDISPDAWYTEAVNYVSTAGLMSGTGAGLFSPEASMTRAMLVTVLYRAAGSPALEDDPAGSSFTDVPEDAWYSAGVEWANREGVAGGYGNGTFGPDDPVTREQLAVVLWRYAGSPMAGAVSSFTDRESISPWAVSAVDWAAEAEVVAGMPGNLFAPGGQATRAQAAVILARFEQLDVPSEPEPSPTPEPDTEPVPEPGPAPTPDKDHLL